MSQVPSDVPQTDPQRQGNPDLLMFGLAFMGPPGDFLSSQSDCATGPCDPTLNMLPGPSPSQWHDVTDELDGVSQIVDDAVDASDGLADNVMAASMRSTTSRSFANPNKLTAHFTKHKSEFGFTNEGQYLAAANNFIDTEGSAGVLSKVRMDGNTVIYNPTTNEFAVVSPSGTILTYFMPDPSVHGYSTNMDYYDAQQ